MPRRVPHFYSGSGMSTGRTGIENTAILVKDFHQGKLSKESLTGLLGTKLDKVKLQVLEKGAHFVKKSPPEKKAAIACEKMCTSVNDLCQLLTKKPLEGEHAYKIVRTTDVTPLQPKFKLEVKNSKDNWVSIDAEVGKEGGIIVKGEPYATILDAVIALEHK